MEVDIEKIKALHIFMLTRPPYSTFPIGDASRRWFCAACGRKSEPAGELPGLTPIPHTENCRERAHWRGIEVL